MVPPPASKAVLRGPKLPTWACGKCDRTANWACRVDCACGAKAPAGVAKNQEGARGPREAREGRWWVSQRAGWRRGGADLTAAIMALRKKRALVSRPWRRSPRRPRQTTTLCSCRSRSWRRRSSATRKPRSKGSSSQPLTRSWGLGVLRKKRLEAKSPQSQVISLNGKLLRLQSKKERLDKSKLEKAEAVKDARGPPWSLGQVTSAFPRRASWRPRRPACARSTSWASGAAGPPGARRSSRISPRARRCCTTAQKDEGPNELEREVEPIAYRTPTSARDRSRRRSGPD